MASRLARIGLLGGWLSLLGGCGGSGGSGGGAAPPPPPPPPPPAFEGLYHLGFFRGTTQPTADVAAALWGVMDSDGVDTITTGVTDENENGVLSTPSGALSGTFEIAADGTTAWLNLGVAALRGGTSAERHAQVVGSVRDGSTVSSLAILLRRSGAFGTSSLDGRYRVCTFGQFGGAHIATVGNLIFDGSGVTATRLLVQNVDGTVTNPGTDSSGTYFVLVDGRVSLSDGVEGGILEGGEVVLLGGTQATGSPPFLSVAIKDAPAATDATFSGTYSAVFFEFDTTGGRYRTLVATAVPDGAGSMILSGTLHAEGTVGILPATTVSYSVGVNGALTVGSGFGAVSGDGVFAVLGGATTNGQSPTFAFFVRQ